jgi:hypothetical protein
VMLSEEPPTQTDQNPSRDLDLPINWVDKTFTHSIQVGSTPETGPTLSNVTATNGSRCRLNLSGILYAYLITLLVA